MYISQTQAFNSDKTFNFVSLSAALHFALFLAALTVTIQTPDIKPIEIAIIESPKQKLQSEVPPLGNLESKKKQVTDNSKNDILDTKKPAARSATRSIVKPKNTLATSKQNVAKVLSKQTKQNSKKQISPKTVVAVPSNFKSQATAKPVQPKVSDSDIAELEKDLAATMSSAVAFDSQDLDDVEINDSLKKAQQDSQQSILGKAKEDLKKLNNDNPQDDQLFAKTQEQLSQEAGQLDQAVQERQQALQQELAASQAKQKAAYEAEMAAAAAAEAATNTNSAQNGSGTGNNKGPNGTGNQVAGYGVANGDPNSTAAVGGVRSLEDLKQRPGNPRPYYDVDERLAKKEGVVRYYAYVTKQGTTTKFKLVESTGHRSLDLKTLKALKQWKFYPGQEGWVELPFQWTLKGGPKEYPSGLRRKL